MINLGKFSKNGKDVILKKEKNGCLRCVSHCTDKDGYVRIRYNKKHDRLFRVLYKQKYGNILKGNVIRHLCNNAWCCNIEHLKEGTKKENAQDMINCGRSRLGKNNIHIRGTKNGSNKLQEKQVKEIYISKKNNKELCEKFNISKTLIWRIRNKIDWKWYTDTLD